MKESSDSSGMDETDESRSKLSARLVVSVTIWFWEMVWFSGIIVTATDSPRLVGLSTLHTQPLQLFVSATKCTAPLFKIILVDVMAVGE